MAWNVNCERSGLERRQHLGRFRAGFFEEFGLKLFRKMKSGKIYLVFAFFILMAGYISWRLYDLQIKKGEYYEAIAKGQQVYFEPGSFGRGEIALAAGETLLANLQEKSYLLINPQKILGADLEKAAEFLAGVLKEPKEELVLVLQKGELIKKSITHAQAEKIEQADITGLVLDQLAVRNYPKAIFACDVLGFVNKEGTGQYGVENFYEKSLKPKAEAMKKETSPLGFFISLSSQQDEDDLLDGFSSGDKIFVSLDEKIQFFSEKLLQKASEDFGIQAGQIIVQDPTTGKILAMADFPFFDPNQYGQEKDLDVFLNSNIQKLFEPGSVFKPIIMASAIEEKLVEPETVYEDKGFADVGGPLIYNFNKKVWGERTMTEVLENSINTGVIFVEQKLGKKKFLDYLEKFGFFDKTGIDLPGEVFSTNDLLKRGYEHDLASAAFGQSIQITPLQLVRAFSCLANNGQMIKPMLVEKIQKADGRETEISVKKEGQILSSQTIEKITKMLVSVVENGSARKAKVAGYYIAAKTGTAQVPKPTGGYYEDKTIQTVAGYFPAYNPKFVVLVKLDNPNTLDASQSAAPIFNQLAEYILSVKQIPPDYPR